MKGLNSRMKYRVGVFLGLTVLCLGFSGCKKQEVTPSVTEVPNVKIGVILDFSGEKSAESEQLYMAMEMAVEEINAAGGVLTTGNKLELVKRDDAGDALNAAGAYYQFADEKVAACIGTNTPETMETLIKITYSNVPLITPTISSNKVTREVGFNFQSCFSDAYLMRANAYYVKNELASKRTAVLVEAGDEYVLSCYQDYMTALLDEKANISLAEEFEFSADKLKEVFDSIVSKEIDSVMILSENPDSIGNVFSAAKACGYKGCFFGMDICREIAVNTEGFDVYVPCDAAIDDPFSGIQEFFDRFHKNYGVAPEDTVKNLVSAYEAIYYVKGAIEDAYTADPHQVVLKLPFLEGSSVTGDYIITAGGYVERAVDFVVINNQTEKYAGSIWR